MENSQQQNKIIERALKGIQNIVVEAVAGSGKTYTLVKCAEAVAPKYKRVTLVAHNVAVRDTLRERLKNSGCENVRIFTLHGLAYRLYNEHFGTKPNIDDDKYRKYLNNNLASIGSELYKSLRGPKKAMYKANLIELINISRHNLKQSEKEIHKLATKKYGMKLVGDECHTVANILKWGAENKDVVDFQDLLWFPSEFGYFTKQYLADIIMVDEAQDCSPAQQDVIHRCLRKGTRVFVFGDEDQSINSWCGSDVDAFKHFKDPNIFNRTAEELALSTNYRCGTNIIEYAKQFASKELIAHDGAEAGIVKHEASLSEVKDGDMVLCRNIAPLMEVYRIFLKSGKKAYFRGEELGRKLIEAMDCANGDTIPEIIRSMKVRLIATWDFLTKEMNVTPKESMKNPQIVSLYDTIQTMEALPETVITREDLEKFTSEFFTNEGQDGIELSTIHRAKGLEADNVFIICPSLVPSKLATIQWEIDEERHLQYVMCTRAKDSLNFVTEREIRPKFSYSDTDSFYKSMDSIRKEVEEYTFI